MKKKFLLSLSLVALPLLLLGNAHAQGIDFVIDWGSQGYGEEAGYNPVTHISTSGNTLTVRAIILDFPANPLAPPENPFLPLGSTGYEYTLVMTGMVSAGTFDGGIIFLTGYSDGTFEIWEDMTPDADFASPITFANGTKIMEGTVSNVSTMIQPNNCPPGGVGSFFCDYTFTGGTVIDPDVVGCGGDIDATWTDDVCIQTPFPAGYVFQTNGHFGLLCPSASTEENSWGDVKTLFR